MKSIRVLQKATCCLLFAVSVSVSSVNIAEAQGSSEANNYLIGTGIYDVTGLVAETTRFGWADVMFRSAGLRDRQYARAFIVAEPGAERVVFVSVDDGALFQSVNQEVSRRLKTAFGGVYSDANVVLSATHTHVSSGAKAHSKIYKLTMAGFFYENFQAEVDGIIGAISRAHANLAPGRIYRNSGTLRNASIQRSMPAFILNPEASTSETINPDMTVLKFVQGEDKEVGAISWFAVHATSLPSTFKLLSSDHKGFAQIEFEKRMGADYGPKSYVAAFAQSDSGDMSPNLNLPTGPYPENATGPGETSEESMEIIGQRQLDKAWEIYQAEGEQLVGTVRAVSRYSKLSQFTVDARFTQGRGTQTTCRAALGTSNGAGAEDGRAPFFPEGEVEHSNWLVALFGFAIVPYTAEDIECQSPKPIAVATGAAGTPWTPEILPTSIFKIGQFGIIAAPGEFTIQSGRRIAKVVAAVPSTGLTSTVLAGYSDAYAGYITTYEEYQSQQYEGASTHFGQDTLGAYLTEYDRLARKLANPNSDPWNGVPEPQSRDLRSENSVDDGPKVLFDDKPFYNNFGSVRIQPAASYQRGDTASVVFQGAHPNNNLRTNDTYLKVQQRVNGAWIDVAYDRDNTTSAIWKRHGIAGSIWTIEWRIPADANPGQYRVRHLGHWKNGWNGEIKPYVGSSRTFTVK